MMLEHGVLLDIVACPTCGKRMQSLSVCHHCGTSYGEMGGTPALFPDKSVHRRVKFEFEPARSVRSDDFEKCFSYPLQSGSAGNDYPFHLDPAHLDVINRLPTSSTILEIGCSVAHMRGFLQSKGYRYVGTDVSKNHAFKQLQQYGGPDILCDAHFLPFAECSFDLVYSSAVTEHLACPYLAVQEVARCLKPGGYYLGNVSFLEPWHSDSFFHMSPLGAFELLTQAKLEPIHIWPGTGYSGFRAIINMGSRVTKPLTFIGDGLFALYNFGNRFRNLIRPANPRRYINDQARVSGATDWIARRVH